MNHRKFNISEAEWEIMRLVWAEAPIGSRTIIDRAQAVTDWKEGTIKSLISRLVDKGALRKNTDQSPYRYEPAISQTEAVQARVDSLMADYCNQQHGQLVKYLIETYEFSQADLQELARLANEAASQAPTRIACTCPPGQCSCNVCHSNKEEEV